MHSWAVFLTFWPTTDNSKEIERIFEWGWLAEEKGAIIAFRIGGMAGSITIRAYSAFKQN